MMRQAVDLSRGLVLLDRDGVINEDIHRWVVRLDDLRLLSNALRAIARLSQAGVRVGVCTNQGAVALGLLDEAMLAQIHEKLLRGVAGFGGVIERIVYCASVDENDFYRKPNAGMLLEQGRYFGCSLAGVPFVGDNWVDVQAARAAGAVPVLVKTGNGARTAHKYRRFLDDVWVFPNLEEAVRQWV